MTPTQFKEAVEDVLHRVRHSSGSNFTAWPTALAAIQTATAELLEGIIGEDEQVYPVTQPRAQVLQAAYYHQRGIWEGRTALRHELRQKAKEMKDAI